MVYKIPKELLRSRHRKEMWKNCEQLLRKIESNVAVSEIYLRGSFTTKKKRPADCDFIIAIKTKHNKAAKWSADFLVVPDSKYGNSVIKDADMWMKQKYGKKNSMFLRLK